MNEEISIKIEPGLDVNSIEFIQHIENELDEVMGKNGFARTTTTKGGKEVHFNFRQFGGAI